MANQQVDVPTTIKNSGTGYAEVLNYSDGSLSSVLSGIVSYYKMDGNATDATGTNNGVAAASVSFGVPQGKINQGAYNNGAFTQDINIPNSVSLNLTTAFSFSLWVYPNAGNTNTYILSKLNAGSTDNDYSIIYGYTAGKVQFYARSTTFLTYSDLVPTVSAWNHIVYTYDGATFKSYLNGANITTQATVQTLASASGNLHLFSFAGSSNAFGGRLDEIGIWSRALTTAEVATLYNSGTGIQYPF
jgi:hypothetical protein